MGSGVIREIFSDVPEKKKKNRRTSGASPVLPLHRRGSEAAGTKRTHGQKLSDRKAEALELVRDRLGNGQIRSDASALPVVLELGSE
jgi:hypothetical protein